MNIYILQLIQKLPPVYFKIPSKDIVYCGILGQWYLNSLKTSLELNEGMRDEELFRLKEFKQINSDMWVDLAFKLELIYTPNHLKNRFRSTIKYKKYQNHEIVNMRNIDIRNDSTWSSEEFNYLLELYAANGKNWKQISSGMYMKFFIGKSPDQCRTKIKRHLKKFNGI
jgi:hypothetical protein